MKITANEIKLVRSLRQKKFRDETGLFVAEGEKMVREAEDSNFAIINEYHIEEIGEKTMGRISMLSTPSPVLAILEQKPFPGKGDIMKLIESKPICLALDSVRDPGNLGTILRIADWFGMDAVFASPDTCDLYNPKVVQASMGSVFHKLFVRTELAEICSKFTECGMEIYGTYLDGEGLRTAPLSGNGLIVMGSESEGISKDITSYVTRKLLINPYPINSRPTDSLNVAMAAAIVCYEFRNR
ncbi:MAG: RNA methyltransferase [Bacteroidales bacterium]|jgi:TrmH family RNA methyltransferase|nr:RNA methyltransferase [Bacteroidales bacterium]MCI2144767.1 RNA methyltransferase [Bacteroidales bacterium]